MHHYRICFSKTDWLKYISHLDLQRAFLRIFQRAALPIAYKKGFNPQPQLSFASPLALGLEGKNEYLDVFLTQPWEETVLKGALLKECPPGIEIKTVTAVHLNVPLLSSLVKAALYFVSLPVFPNKIAGKIVNIFAAEKIMKERKGKKNKKIVDIRPFIFDLRIREREDFIKITMLLATGNQGGARPEELLELLGIKKEQLAENYRQELFTEGEDGLENPSGVLYEDYLQNLGDTGS